MKRKTHGAEKTRHKLRPKEAERAASSRPVEPDPALLKQYREESRNAGSHVAVTRPARRNTPEGWEAWQDAVCRKYEVYKRHVPLFAQHFSAEPLSPEASRYDWDFWRDMELLRGGDETRLEAAVAFLEADPWFHGSGYAKEDIIPGVCRLALPSNVASRLQAVVLNIVEHRHGREFRAFCRLARKVDSLELREELGRCSASDDPTVSRRARWMLEALQSRGKNNDKAA